MATATTPSSRSVLARPAELRAKWLTASATTQLRIKVGVLVGAILLAYHYSLISLLQTIDYDTPLAYVGIVPFIAVGLAFAIGRRPAYGAPDIHDRQLDYILGLPLIAVAVAMEELLPKNQSVLFWIRRMDLLSLPIFVAGAVTLMFGTRTMWRQRIPILYLILAWPWPYTTILLGGLNGFTNYTVDALTEVLKVVHVGAPLAAANGEQGLFTVFYKSHPFPVSVVTACSGVDGMVGFLLVGIAFAVLVEGPRLRKTLWLILGLALLWIDNVGRLVLIFWAGSLWGEKVSINILHPVAGLIIFMIGVLVMVLLLKPFGLSLWRPPPPPAGGGSGGRGNGGSPPHPGPGRKKPQPVFLAAGVVAIVGILLSINNQSFKSFDLVASAAGEPKLASFLVHPATPAGWSSDYETEYTANKSLFGESSRWFRYDFYYNGAKTDLKAPYPVTADIINAANVQGFGAYGVEACYDFHGYTLAGVTKVSLGGGIEGETLSFTTKANGSWSIVYWIVPVVTGSETRYERVILYELNNDNESLTDVQLPGGQLTSLQPTLANESADQRILTVNSAFLVDFAREMVQNQTKVTESSTTNIGQVTPWQGQFEATSPSSNLNQGAKVVNPDRVGSQG